MATAACALVLPVALVMTTPARAVELPLPGACDTSVGPNLAAPGGASFSLTHCGRHEVITKLLASGAVDVSYGGLGRIVIDNGVVTDFMPIAAVVVDGRLVVLTAVPNGGQTTYSVRRYGAAGNVDVSFGVSGVRTFTSALRATKLELDGFTRPVVTLPGGTGVTFIRLTTAGALDASFGTGGTVVRDGLGDYGGSRVLASGHIVWSDYSAGLNSGVPAPAASAVGVERLLVNGDPDVAYGTSGFGYSYAAQNVGSMRSQVAFEADGRATIQMRSGSPTDPTAEGFRLMRFTASGVPDPTFGLGGGSTGVGAIIGREGPVIAPDGAVITWRSYGSGPPAAKPELFRFPATGAAQTGLFTINFGPAMFAGNYSVLGVDGAGRIYLVGAQPNIAGTQTRIGVVRVLVDAMTGALSVDTTYGASGYFIADIPGVVTTPIGAVTSDGHLRLGTDPVVQFDASGAPDPTWTPPGLAPLNTTVAYGPPPPLRVFTSITDAGTKLYWAPIATNQPIIKYVIEMTTDNGVTWSAAGVIDPPASDPAADGMLGTAPIPVPAGSTVRFRVASRSALGTGVFSLASATLRVETTAYSSTIKSEKIDGYTGTVTLIDRTAGTQRLLQLGGQREYQPAETVAVSVAADITQGGTFWTLPASGDTPPTLHDHSERALGAVGEPTVVGTLQADENGKVAGDAFVGQFPPGYYFVAITGTTSGVGEKARFQIVETDDGVVSQQSTLNPLTPVRVFDTRPTEWQGAVEVAKQPVGGDHILSVKVAGVGGVPLAGLAAVSLNVTAVDPVGSGFVTVYPCGDRPLSSNVNYVKGQVVPNAVIAPVSADGTVCFYSQVDTHLVVDVNGWFADGLGFRGVTPLRVFDTRASQPQGAVAVTQQRYGEDKVLSVKVAGIGGVPVAGAGAVALNVTAVDPDGAGYITVYPCGERPLASNLNFVSGQVVPNAVIAPLSPDGTVCFYSSVGTDIVADVNGWFVAHDGFEDLQPARLFDTRTSEPQGVVPITKQRYGGGNILTVKITGVAGVPSGGVGAVSLNVTAVGPDGPGYVTVFPCGDRPLSSNLNFVAGQTVPNAVIAPVSADGTVCFFSLVDTDLIADINAWAPLFG